MRRAAALVLAGALLVALAACSSDDASTARSTTSASTAPAEPVVATVAPVPPGVEDCGTQNDLAGWPTTMVASADAYACLVDALASGTPAQMSSVVASDGESGRTTDDGYDIPTRRITTWVVIGPDQVEETIDRTEDGGSRTTRTCRALSTPGIGVPPSGNDCS